jgi:hypothetical protein
LESQASSEEIISSLTAKNLDLEELNRQLTMESNELEELHQVDEEIIEAQKETEKDLLLKNEEQLITIAAVFIFHYIDNYLLHINLIIPVG